MSKLTHLSTLEARFTGPIPPEELARLWPTRGLAHRHHDALQNLFLATHATIISRRALLAADSCQNDAILHHASQSLNWYRQHGRAWYDKAFMMNKTQK